MFIFTSYNSRAPESHMDGGYYVSSTEIKLGYSMLTIGTFTAIQRVILCFTFVCIFSKLFE